MGFYTEATYNYQYPVNIEEDIVPGQRNRMKNCFMRIGGVLKYC